MLEKIRNATCLGAMIILCTIANSQTTTINYLSNSNLSTTACNVFSPAVNVNGVSHSSHAGGVSFNATNGLLLPTRSGQGAGGTAFYISYNFTSGSNYDISIKAKETLLLF